MSTSNCKRMVQMISLYVGGDLVGAPEREVAAHLADCEKCRQLAGEFSESSSLLTQAFTPPEFGAEFYSGIRSAVLREITRDRMLAKPSLFRRRWLYATSFAVVVITAAVLLQYFGSRLQTPPAVAYAPQVLDQPTSRLKKETNSPSSGQLTELPQSPQKSRGLTETPKLQSHKIQRLVNAPGSSRQFETDATVTAQTAIDKPIQIWQVTRPLPSVTPAAVESAALSDGSVSIPATPSGRASNPRVSRIEIQTADPNIRIIWLAPHESGKSEETNHDSAPHENGDRK